MEANKFDYSKTQGSSSSNFNAGKSKILTIKNLSLVVLCALMIYIFGTGISLIIRSVLTIESGALPFDITNLSSVTNLLSAAITSVSVALVLIGFNRSNTAREKEVALQKAEFYHKFVNRWLETDRYIMQHHRVRKYFYDKNTDITELLASGSAEDEDKYHEAMCLCEYLEDFDIYLGTEIERDYELGNESIAKEQLDSYRCYLKEIKDSSAFREYRSKYSWINGPDQ